MLRKATLVVICSAVAALSASAALAMDKPAAQTHPHGDTAASATGAKPEAAAQPTQPKAAAADESVDTDDASGRTPAPPDARVYFISPHDGDSVTNPFIVRFGLAGMGVAPSGVERPATGHFHLLIDVDEPPAPDEVIPSDAQHRHYGGGQTQTQLSLPPGKHTLQLLIGDAHHIPTDPVVISRVITINVINPAPKAGAAPATKPADAGKLAAPPAADTAPAGDNP